MGNNNKSNGARKDRLHLPRPPRRRLGGDGGAGTRKRRLASRQPRVRQPLGRGRRRQRRRGHGPPWPRRRWLPLDCGFLHALLWYLESSCWRGRGLLRRSKVLITVVLHFTSGRLNSASASVAHAVVSATAESIKEHSLAAPIDTTASSSLLN